MSISPVRKPRYSEADLAVRGGSPVRSTPFPEWPHFAEDEVEAASAVLRSGKVNYWTGPAGRTFEKEFAEYTGCTHAIALANGTVALELALFALGIGPGDEVIVPSRTFIASASCVAARGAAPVVADVDRDSGNLNAETVRAVLSARTKAIIPVHLGGWPCDMDPIMELARKHQLKVVEDCAQALGATYKGSPVGCMGDVGAFSFCQDKIITTAGEGGMFTTQDASLWNRAWSYKDHGKSYDAAYTRQHAFGFRWLHESFGSNMRMTEVQSAIGRSQMLKLPGWLKKRRHFAGLFDAGLAGVRGLRVVRPPAGCGHSYYKYYVYVQPEQLNPGWDRDRIAQAIIAEGIPCGMGSCSEIYREKAFDHIRPPHRLPAAQELGDTSLMFMVHPTLCDGDILESCEAVEKVMAVAAR